MKYWKAFIFYLIAFILQPFIYGLIPALGINLNMILCLTVIFTFVYDDILPGLFFGPIFGLLTDVMYASYVGPNALAIAVTGVMVFIVKEYINKENLLNAVITLIISTWIFVSVLWVVYYCINSPYSYIYAMKYLPLQIIFNTIAGTVLYSVLIKKVIKHRKDRYFR